VLRFQPGACFQLFDGLGQIAEVILHEQGQVEITQVRTCPEPHCHLSLIQGMPKGDKLELVLQKGTELGVNHFALVEMARSVGQLKGERRNRRLERWHKIIQESARQSQQYHLPQLSADLSFAATLTQIDAEEKLILWEQCDQPLTSVLSKDRVKSVAVVVGPEGGISADEVELAESLGYKAVGLGPRILRTETAGLAIMSILQYLYGDLSVVDFNESSPKFQPELGGSIQVQEKG
jgi:16S rRNA (uracil1498-N3)-methyltransferase